MLYKGDTLYLDWLEDGIAELVFDAPGSVNKLDTATVASLGEAIGVLEQQSDLKGLLLRSNKAAFIVGADITEFLSLFLVPEEQLSQWLHFANSVFNRLEDLPVPTIAAVNGYALGGGCECVLATDYRLATPDLRIGLPETKLGIMPGFGGSVRMPRMLGADSALEIIAAGKDVGADQALKIGLVDGVVKAEKLVEGAKAVLRQAINGDLDWKAKRQPKLEPLKLSKIEATMSFTIAKGMVAQTAGKHYPAPITAVKTIEAAARFGREEALNLENKSFVPLAHTNEARALLLLQSNGLIKLKDGAGLTATRRDIAENPKKLKIEEIEAAQLVRALPDVDLAIINGNYAILGGLKVADALSAEKADSIAATTYANILAVRAGDENRPELKALIDALKSDQVKEFMTKKYEGAVVPAN